MRHGRLVRLGGEDMHLEQIASLIEDALQNGLDGGIRAVREGDTERALDHLERANAKLNAALEAVRVAHGDASPIVSGASALNGLPPSS